VGRLVGYHAAESPAAIRYTQLQETEKKIEFKPADLA